MSNTQQIGFLAEQAACVYLQKQGLKLITQNFRCDAGEIDLIMQENDMLVFVEVRFRQHKNYGHGIETISPSKKQRLIRTALFYLQENHLIDKVPCRFDVLGAGPESQIIWITNAFEVEY